MALVKNDWQIKKQIEEFKARAKELLPPMLKNEIINESILKGISPVKGAGRFKKYSESYLEQISKIANKRASPVNLKRSGDLIKSFTIKKIEQGLEISFKDEKAEYHDNGTNRIPQRKMLPTRTGESFSVIIQRSINRILNKILNEVRRN